MSSLSEKAKTYPSIVLTMEQPIVLRIFSDSNEIIEIVLKLDKLSFEIPDIKKTARVSLLMDYIRE